MGLFVMIAMIVSDVVFREETSDVHRGKRVNEETSLTKCI